MHFEFHVCPDKQQFSLLESMLEGPVLLQRLLALSDQPLGSIDDAARFLDKHWQRLVPYMFRKGRGQGPKAVEQLILRMAHESTDRFQIDFNACCSLTNDQRVTFPIPELGPIALARVGDLAAARAGQKHAGDFSLIRTLVGYSVAIRFDKKSPLADKAKTQFITPVPPRNHRPKIVQRTPVRLPARPLPHYSGISAGDFLAAFNNRVTAHLNHQLAVGRNFAGSRFDELSGWGVSGGLCSLGKNS